MKKIALVATVCVALFFAGTVSVNAQSRSFELGKLIEIHTSVLKELNRNYVDTLPYSRMGKAGIEAMLAELDPYTVYVPEEESEDLEMLIGKTYGGVGAIIYKPEKQGNVIINEPYEGSPACRAGLRCGDEIEAIDGVSTHGLETKECSDRMKGKPGTEVVLTVKKLRSGAIEDVKILRERIHLPDVEYSGMVGDTTAYIYISGFTDGVGQQIRAEVEKFKSEGKMKKLVLDFRGNGGGLLSEAVEIVSCFVPKGSLVVTAKGRSNTAQGQAKAASGAQGQAEDENFREYRTTKAPVDTELPLVILVDSGSASASEIVSGALQDLDRAVIMGLRTFGKGLVQGMRPLPYGGQLKVTTAKYYTPSGRCVQAIDYSHRNEDGSVGHIPDSLTHEFKTAGGRTVRDGGGITPDVKIEAHKYSRLTYSLVMSGVVEHYALEFVRKHESIPALEDFHFAEYDDFVEFAKTQKFDYRSSAKTYFDQARKELREDGLEDSMKEQLDALENALNMEKETFLRLKKDEIIPFIEEEIAVRYYFQKAGIAVRLRYDTQLHEALSSN